MSAVRLHEASVRSRGRTRQAKRQQRSGLIASKARVCCCACPAMHTAASVYRSGLMFIADLYVQYGHVLQQPTKGGLRRGYYVYPFCTKCVGVNRGSSLVFSFCLSSSLCITVGSFAWDFDPPVRISLVQSASWSIPPFFLYGAFGSDGATRPIRSFVRTRARLFRI